MFSKIYYICGSQYTAFYVLGLCAIKFVHDCTSVKFSCGICLGARSKQNSKSAMFYLRNRHTFVELCIIKTHSYRFEECCTGLVTAVALTLSFNEICVTRKSTKFVKTVEDSCFRLFSFSFHLYLISNI